MDDFYSRSFHVQLVFVEYEPHRQAVSRVDQQYLHLVAVLELNHFDLFVETRVLEVKVV